MQMQCSGIWREGFCICSKLTCRAWQVIFGGCQCPGDPAGSLLRRLCWGRRGHRWGRRSGGSWLLHSRRAWIWSHRPSCWTWADRRLQRSCSNAATVSHANRNAPYQHNSAQKLPILSLSNGDSIFLYDVLNVKYTSPLYMWTGIIHSRILAPAEAEAGPWPG